MNARLLGPHDWRTGPLMLMVASACWVSIAAQTNGNSARAQTRSSGGDSKRGEYLVNSVGCNDCHTPHKLGPNGPEPDVSRMLSGHPADMKLPPAPSPAPPWIASFAATMTAWAGPWGVSYTANLTPDPETGLGNWTEQQFIDALRSGRHQGRGRQILPPMPWQAFRNLSDADLKAIFAYLRTIPPVKNRVPDPVMAAAGPSTR